MVLVVGGVADDIAFRQICADRFMPIDTINIGLCMEIMFVI